MAGWKEKNGIIADYQLSEDHIWSLFNFVFSSGSKKRNTYKFGLIKSLLDNVFNGTYVNTGVYYTYEEIFGRFAENYWNLVVKYDLRQMKPDGKSIFSKVESILKDIAAEELVLTSLEFDSLDDKRKTKAIKQVTAECKKYVLGALYNDFEGTIYSFDLKNEGLVLNPCIHEFMLKYKSELEKLNYYAWARFLEQVNDENALTRVLEKLELSTPRRNNLLVYREILRQEFEQNNCFYCGKKLQKSIHVDHFIPWSFVKVDKMWNFVLACSSCNEKKNNKIPKEKHLYVLEDRNKKLQLIENVIIQNDFYYYSEEKLHRMWNYARLSGLKEWE